MDLIVLFVDVCLFKRGPQDVPASRFLLGLALVAYWGVGVVLLGLENDWWEAVVKTVIESLLLLAFCWIMLLLARRRARLLQTATTLLATDALISLPGALLLSWWLARPEAPGLQLGLLAVTVWQLSVMAHVLRLAVSRPLVLGVALALTYVGVSYTVMTSLFEGPL